MPNHSRRDRAAALESISAPNVGFGSLFTTANTAPTVITRFLGAVNGQAFEILVLDDYTTFRQGPFLRTSTGKDVAATNGAVYRFLWRDGVSHMSR